MPIYSHLTSPPLGNWKLNASPGKTGLRTVREHREMNEIKPCENKHNVTLPLCCHTYNLNKIIFLHLRTATVML